LGIPEKVPEVVHCGIS